MSMKNTVGFLRLMMFMLCMVLQVVNGEQQSDAFQRRGKHSSNSRLPLSITTACYHLGPLLTATNGRGFAAATSPPILLAEINSDLSVRVFHVGHPILALREEDPGGKTEVRRTDRRRRSIPEPKQ
ncbi:hypothetical protein LR48_Vigan07g171500 [Vigna angularis]|uniref:Secreted protein n=1 Tax=Phaseolus angularis TaxID=3914 RepID=A0A0L9UZA0_PHAAN|nr:hypothetical protein LR48_Vigan07g171500 [Vigna angularis]